PHWNDGTAGGAGGAGAARGVRGVQRLYDAGEIPIRPSPLVDLTSPSDRRQQPHSRSSASHALPATIPGMFIIVSQQSRSEVQTQMRQKLLKAFPALEQSQRLVQAFHCVLRDGSIPDFDAWMTRVLSSNLTDIATFARGLEQDRKAVEAAITETWS